MAFCQPPSDRELEILKILWDCGPSTVREVTTVMCQTETLAQNTVQTFLRLMEEKGLVAHRESGRAFVYHALYLRHQVVTGFIKSIFDGAIDQLVLNAVDTGSLTEGQIRAIETKLKQMRHKGPA